MIREKTPGFRRKEFAMLSNLILYRSLTQTQKASAALGREGIPNRVIRAPRAVSTEGCGHCVRLAQRDLFRALSYLNRIGLSPRRVFVTAGDGNYEEVPI